MSKAAHTAGPWSVEGPDPFGDYNILGPISRLAIGAVVSNLRAPAEVAANARTFAAAPELLAACELALLDSVNLSPATVDVIQDAVALAKGGAA